MLNDHQSISKESLAYWLENRKNPQFGAPGNEFNLEGLRQGMSIRQEPAVPGTVCIHTDLGHIPLEWVIAPGADPDLRLLYLHGGGFVSGSGANYLPLAAQISQAAQCAVLLPDYRLAPEYPFPAGLEDCLAAFSWMIANGPNGESPARATCIAGDSAGGGLTLATLLALQERSLPLPHGGITLSAFADLTLAGQSIHSQAKNELFMHPSCLPRFVELYLGSGPECQTLALNPLASPVFGDFRGLPPLLIQVGEYEVIYDDSLRVADKALADGVDVTFQVWPGQVHVFQIRGLPESQRAIQEIAKFIGKISVLA